ncbi:Peptidyl-prolyl cis-trans isomerase-like 2 [Sphaceloma murrayae]|uniref:Peptidyl-prolyl cis-trans isomerase-like 2 n=1 Tax=Sphaceloma murrayae TaxID=2082308 RepID=A0A2K1QVZ4_9PEZI|nr:Peptidyl-prolyl cis-trans isomerase-like 2 [Sphaceloma murrayae]
MGKGTDKLYITQSEWSSHDSFSASAGSNARRSENTGLAFSRLPFNFCSLSLQPFQHPVCTSDGIIFDLTNILPWLKKNGTNPVDGSQLKASELLKLNFAKNDDGEYVDPVTYKVFTDNTHIVALRMSGNVFAYETVDRLNIKAKNWQDLVSDEKFERADIITLQDPQNVSARDLNSFKHVKEGEKVLTAEQEEGRAAGINLSAMGSSAKILKAKEAVAKARAEREAAKNGSSNGSAVAGVKRAAPSSMTSTSRAVPYNAAKNTTGKAAASFTSTGLTPHTGAEYATLSEEDYLLKPKRVKLSGFATMATTHGDLTLELYPEHAPKAVWNFLRLSQKGYYDGVSFHRNIRNFMIQGGDPTGTGRGGASIWGKNFEDQFDGPLTHDGRGVLSMANKGKDTNSSQFFITYRAVKHLDRKHTIFGRVVEGTAVLDKLEKVPTDDKDRPQGLCAIKEVRILSDPFEEFLAKEKEKEDKEKTIEELRRQGGTEDDKTTWTGKKIGRDGRVADSGATVGVGKYLKATQAEAQGDEIVGEWEELEPVKKKAKAGGFGNFDSW